MKKKLIIIISVLALLALGVGAWFFGYYNRKSLTNIPSKKLMVTFFDEKGEDYASEQLEGYSREQVVEIWGEPQGMLSGARGEVWKAEKDRLITVYYDAEIKVERIKVSDPLSVLEATIIEISDPTMLVEPVEGSWELSSADRISVPMKNMSPSPEPQVGDRVVIVYSGGIQETYPAGLSEVISITVAEKAQENSSNDLNETKEEADAQSDGVNWGLTLSAKDVTATGLTLVVTQSGGAPTGDLQFGSDFSLQVWKDKQWEKVPYSVSEDSVAWTEEAYMVPMEGITEQEIGWEYLYGSLPEGKYLLTKSFMDFRGTGDYDTAVYSVEFEF